MMNIAWIILLSATIIIMDKECKEDEEGQE